MVEALNNLLDTFVGFIPLLVTFIVIVVLGKFLGGVVRKVLQRVPKVGETMIPGVVGRVVFYVALYVALTTIGVDLSILEGFLGLIIGGVVLGLALAFGFGNLESSVKETKKLLKSLFNIGK